MKISKGFIAFLLVFTLLLSSCTTVPVTGRKQFNIVPGFAMLSMSLKQYDDFLKTHTLSKNNAQTQLVKNVGKKIQKAVEQYFAQQDKSYELKDYEWEFNLVESEEVNAWAMPGGKVVVYEGLLPIAKGEKGLAVVLGHEIAHAIAKHGDERVSQGLIAQGLGVALTTALKEKPDKTKQIWMTAFGLGAQFGVMLPFSRLQESEADYLGLVFMTIAGYDPHEAIGLWERMAEMKKGQAPPEFMSTHPSDATRIRKISEAIPEVLKNYD